MEAIGQSAFVRAQPLIAVRNVRASSSWYQQLLGLDTLPEHPHRAPCTRDASGRGQQPAFASKDATAPTRDGHTKTPFW